MIREAYKPIDLHTEHVSAWPEAIPELTDAEAARAWRRLWRFSMGEAYTALISFSSGNRRPTRWHWEGNRRCVTINTSAGWREFVHDASHLFVHLCNPGDRPHSKFHARFEAKLVREVIKRGWLEGKLRDAPKAAEQPIDELTQRRRDKLARIAAGLERWDSKLRRAERAIAKLQKSRRYYARALGVES